jgi:signal transduction histidine kinase
VKTLGGRIGLVLLAFALATLLAIGGSLWFVLRELHRDATIGALTELTVPYATTVRSLVPNDVLRPSGPSDDDDDGERDFVDRIRTNDGDLTEFRETLLEEITEANVSLIFTVGESSYIVNPAEGVSTSLSEVPEIEQELSRGQVVTGSTEIEGMGDVLYATTPIIGPLRQGGQGARARSGSVTFLMLARADDSAERATADLVRALTVAALILVLIGIPLAVGLSRSVTNPLRRLAEATGDVAQGKVPEPLPVSGPIEVAEASAAFNTMASEVGATREAQRQLLADIRHDLRTPLTVIGGFSQALKDGTASGEVAVRAADAISDETDRLGRMLDDLDHLTVPGVAGPPLHLESLDSLAVARHAVERFTAEAESRGQILSVADDAEGTRFVADLDALDRILGNIIANALKHAPSPGGHVTVEVFASGHRVTLSVLDDGPGIPASALPHVFDRFYRADPSRTGSGSGLGLAIVRDLAEALDGECFAENVEGSGARVGVRLPTVTTSAHQPGRA